MFFANFLKASPPVKIQINVTLKIYGTRHTLRLTKPGKRGINGTSPLVLWVYARILEVFSLQV